MVWSLAVALRVLYIAGRFKQTIEAKGEKWPEFRDPHAPELWFEPGSSRPNTPLLGCADGNGDGDGDG